MIDKNVLRLLADVANKTVSWETHDNLNTIGRDFSDLVSISIVQPFDLDPYVNSIKTTLRYLPELWIQRGVDQWHSANVPGSFFVIGVAEATKMIGWDVWRNQLCNALNLGRLGFDSGAYLLEGVVGDSLNRHWLEHSDTAPQKLQFYESIIASHYTTDKTISECLKHWEASTQEQRQLANPELAEWYTHVNDLELLVWRLRNPTPLNTAAYPVASMIELQHS